MIRALKYLRLLQAILVHMPHKEKPARKKPTVSVEIELNDTQILHLAMEAHRRDITLNALINIILREYIESREVPC